MKKTYIKQKKQNSKEKIKLLVTLLKNFNKKKTHQTSTKRKFFQLPIIINNSINNKKYHNIRVSRKTLRFTSNTELKINISSI